MDTPKTAGQKLVALLDTGLPNGIVWSAKERAVLGQIEATADEIEVLKKLLAAEVKAPDRSTHKCAELLGEIRMARGAIAKMVATLDPEMVVQAKSVRHQNAINPRRWSEPWELGRAYPMLNPTPASTSSRIGTTSTRRTYG